MYLSHFGLNEPPFRITPDTGFFFAGANRGPTLDALQYAILHEEGIVKVSGEVGSGKTMLCRVLIERLPKAVEIIYLASPSLARDEILLAIADELGMNPDMANAPGTRLLRALQEKLISLYSEGRRVVVLIDEAHAMPKETLEEIRLLSNLESRHNKLLQIVLFGQPELDEHLDSTDMRPLKERITHSFRLEPLIRTDVEGYIEFRLRAAGYRGPNPFAAGAIRLISDASLGLTRRINILCDKALLAAFAANSHAVTEREARRAIADSAFKKLPGRINRVALAIVGAVFGLAAGLAIAWVWTHGEPPRSAAPAVPAASLPAPVPASITNTVQAGDSNAAVASDSAIPGTPFSLTSSVSTRLDSVLSNAGQGQTPRAAASPVADPSDVPPSPGTLQTAARLSLDPAKASAPDARAASRPNFRQLVAPEVAGNSAGGQDHYGARDTESQRPVDSPVPPESGKMAQQRFLATQNWFKKAPMNRYSIQLMAIKHTELNEMENFLRKASELVGEDDLFVYSVRINGEQYYRASYGNYIDLGEIREAMKTLPALFLIQQPFPRSFAQMRRHNSQ